MYDPDPLAGYRFADRYSVQRAAMLIAGVDPTDIGGDSTRYAYYLVAFEALRNAVLWNTLPAALAYRPATPSAFGDNLPNDGLTVVLSSVADVEKLRGMPSPDLDKPLRLQAEPDWERTTVDVEDLKAWLRARRQFPAFFFRDAVPSDFMNKDHPRYSPKLACAVAAWKEVTQQARNKSVKQTLEDWVRAHAARFGVLDKQHRVSKTAVEEIAKVVNWAPEGGATPLGGGQVPETSPPLPSRPAQNYEPLRNKLGKTDG